MNAAAAKNTRGPAIGIDLGTTYSCVGYWKDGRVEIIQNEQGNRTTPSYVAFTDGERLIGEAAFNQVALNPINTVFDAKRLIGRRFSDEIVQNDIKLWPFKVISGKNDRPAISITYKGEKKQFAAEEISSMVLTKMKQIAEAYIGSEVKDAVVTVPAYFDHSQRQATMDAGEIAGINILRLIMEPTAAAVAYGLDNFSEFTQKRNVLVFDLGGGTFDVSLLAIKNSNMEVKATCGDTHLGGEDFDDRLVNHYINEFKAKHGKDIGENPRSLRRLRSACERAKRILSSAGEARIEIDALFDGIDFSTMLTRPKFEELNFDLFLKCIETVNLCLTDAKMNKNAVDDIVMVGGSSRIPKVQQLLQDLLNGKELCRNINPDEAVAFGAAIQAANLSGNLVCLKDIDSPASRNAGKYGGSGGQAAESRRQRNDSIMRMQKLVLTEVTPLSLGVQSKGDVMDVLIPRNTAIPSTKSRDFVVTEDNLTSVPFNVYEGERAKATENRFLGYFILSGIQQALRGIPKIDVTFELEASGLLKVSAKDRVTGSRNSIAIKSESLSKQDIQTMITEASKFKEEDDLHRKKSKASLDFVHYVYQMRESVTSDTSSAFDKAKVAEAVKSAFEWIDATTELREVREYEEKMKELVIVWKPNSARS